MFMGSRDKELLVGEQRLPAHQEYWLFLHDARGRDLMRH